MKRVALIPARGGSKRLPRKNVMKFLGKPMITHTIDAAQQSGLFDRIVVSTEDEEIAIVSKSSGVAVSKRPSNLAGDTVMVKDVCIDFLNKEKKSGRNWDILCVLYATSPLRNIDDIKSVVSLIEADHCDFALAVTSYSQPLHQALLIDENNYAKAFLPDLVSLRADEVPEFYVDNGSTYAVSVSTFQKTLSFYGNNMRTFKMPRKRSIDIDTREDFELLKYYSKVENF